MPEVSVIIPTYNGRHKIGKILKSLKEQSFKDFDTIVIIDGSTDDTDAYLKSKDWGRIQLKIENQDNQGRAKVRNNGAEHASGEFLIFLDDDMLPGSKCIEAHVNLLRKEEKSLSAGRAIEHVSDSSTGFQKFRLELAGKWENNLLSASMPLDDKNLFLAAANFGIRRQDFKKLRGFDEELKDAEDLEFARRAFWEGFKIFYNKDAIATHNDEMTCKNYILRLREYKNSHQQLALMRKPYLENCIPSYQSSLIKRILYFPFSAPFWVAVIDRYKPIRIFPKSMRYKFYFLVVIALSYHFSSRNLSS